MGLGHLVDDDGGAGTRGLGRRGARRRVQCIELIARHRALTAIRTAGSASTAAVRARTFEDAVAKR